MASSDIYMCDFHLERRGFGRYDWLVPDEDNPCTRCATGLYPDWELSSEYGTEKYDKALEDHVARLLKEYYGLQGTDS